MNGLISPSDSLREANRARKQVLIAELERIQAQKEAVEQQLAALGRVPIKAAQGRQNQQLALAGGPKKRPSQGVPLADARPAKRPNVPPDWQKKEQQVWNACQSIHKNMCQKGNNVQWFLVPVSPTQAVDYYQIIKKPMDLGTVGKKLNKGGHRGYTDPMQFQDDMRLIWKNCSMYNGAESIVGKAGLFFSEKFEREWSKNMLEDKWQQAQLAKQQAAQEQRNGVSAEEFHSLGRQLHDVTERMDVRINPGPPGPDREMTFDEKRKLSVFMGALDGDKLGKVIEIIEQEQPDLPGSQDGEIELDLDSLSRKALWALHDLYISSGAARNGPPRKGGGGRSGTPGPPRASSQQAQLANQPEVSSQRSPAVKKEGSGATGGGPAHAPQHPAIADSSTSSDDSSDDDGNAAREQPQKMGPGPGPTLMSTNHQNAPTILPGGGAKARQDTKLANAAAWSNLGAANEEEDGQKGNEEEEDNGDGLWNTFQSRDDIEREKKQREVREKEEAIRRQTEQQAQEAAAAAVKAEEEEQRLKAAEAARQQEEVAESQRAMEEQKAKDRARLEAQAQENDLEGAKTVHKMLHTAKAPADGGLALRGDDSEDDFGEDEDDVEGAANEEGEVEEI